MRFFIEKIGVATLTVRTAQVSHVSTRVVKRFFFKVNYQLEPEVYWKLFFEGNFEGGLKDNFKQFNFVYIFHLRKYFFQFFYSSFLIFTT